MNYERSVNDAQGGEQRLERLYTIQGTIGGNDPILVCEVETEWREGSDNSQMMETQRVKRQKKDIQVGIQTVQNNSSACFSEDCFEKGNLLKVPCCAKFTTNVFYH